MTQIDPSKIIPAILEEARLLGKRRMLRTTLVKFLYLLDVYTAEDSEGRHLSGWEWRFLHFGPFAAAAAASIDHLADLKQIDVDQHETENGDKEYTLYGVSERAHAERLADLGVPRYAVGRIQMDIQKYTNDLPALLNKVYFWTAPMSSPRPGDILEFATCRKLLIEDFRSVEMRPLGKKAVKRTREKLRDLISARKAALEQKQVEDGPYDEIYFAGLAELESDPITPGLTGTAKIKVE